MNIIFENWHQWKVCFVSGVRNASWGIWRIITCIFLGILSVFVFCGKQIEAFCKRETVAAVIVGVVIAMLIFGWTFTFVKGRVAQKTAEYQRDSISYCLSKYQDIYDSPL